MNASAATVHRFRSRSQRRSDSGVDLSIAIQQSGHTVKGIARCSGMSEAKIRALQDGRHGLTLSALASLPPEVRDPILTEYAKRLGLEVFRPIESRGGFMSVVRKLLSAASKLPEAVWDIGQRGRLTRAEAAVVKPLVRELRQSAAAIERLCDQAEKEGVVGLPEDEPR